MKNPNPLTKFAMIMIGPMFLGVSLPAMAVEIHGDETSFNLSLGSSTLNFTTGNNNTASGTRALRYNTTGKLNTASGSAALKNNTEGDFNTAIGYRAGGFNKSGSRSVFIGYRAGDNVGYSNKSDQLVIANGPLPVYQLLVGDFSKRTLLINGRTSINGDVNVRGNLKVQGKAFAASFEKSDGA